MIKILTGWSDPGGSTESFIRLTNMLNSKGHETALYGPHRWHLDKCQSDMLKSEMRIDADDVVLVHFLPIKKRLPCKKMIYVSHEKQLSPVTKQHYNYDVCVFLHDKHRAFHGEYKGPAVIIPNLYDEISVDKRDGHEHVAGVIGTVDTNKRTHVAIQRAIEQKYKQVNIYGTINDPAYYEQHVKPLVDDKHVVYKGFCTKQEIYSSIHAAFLASVSECASLVQQECHQTNTLFYGDDEIMYDIDNVTNVDITNMWIDLVK